MIKIDSRGYILHKTNKNNILPRNWYLVKCGSDGNYGYVYVCGHKQLILFPKEYIGKRIRIKIEVLE